MLNKYSIALLPYHPVDYQVPFYQALHKHPRIQETIIYPSRLGLQEKFEPEFNSTIKWGDTSLLQGYNYKFLKNFTFNESAIIIGRINPGILQEIKHGKYDAILITGYVMISAFIAILAAKLFGTKIILRAEAHLENPSASLLRKLKNRFLGRILAGCDAVMYSCETNRQYFKHFGVPDEKLFPILSSVNNTYLSKKREQSYDEGHKLRHFYGIGDEDVVFLFVGRLTARKRPQDLIHAHKQLAHLPNKTWLLFVGDGPLRDELENEIKRVEIKNVIFSGFQNASEIPIYLNMSDVFVLPSQYDPTPKVINEAMVFGLPCLVSTGVGTANDLVKHDYNGFVFETGNISQIASHMSTLVKNPELRLQMGKAAEQEVTKWSPEANAQGVVEALDYCFGVKHE
jgi:glycosyltransferase involved in cell wall biosynthesis